MSGYSSHLKVPHYTYRKVQHYSSVGQMKKTHGYLHQYVKSVLIFMVTSDKWQSFPQRATCHQQSSVWSFYTGQLSTLSALFQLWLLYAAVRVETCDSVDDNYCLTPCLKRGRVYMTGEPFNGTLSMHWVNIGIWMIYLSHIHCY